MSSIVKNKIPLVSVITVFKDEGKFLDEAIRSVLAQTWHHWELYLVDDGSSDRSTEIACAYAERYPDIHYLEHKDHKNKGTSTSRNLGTGNCKGELISFLDGDDIYLPEKLAAQVANFNKYPDVDMVIDATNYWYSWSPNNKHTDFTQHIGFPDKTIFAPGELNLRYLDRTAAIPCMGGVMVRRSLLDKIMGFEEQFTGMYDDQVFFHKAAMHGTVMISREVHDKYRQHENSMCYQVKQNGQINVWNRQFLEWLSDYISETEHTRLKRYIQLEFVLNRHPRILRIYRILRKLQAAFLDKRHQKDRDRT
jgi:glycosyltransferase involved in cell wall biosynthesis